MCKKFIKNTKDLKTRNAALHNKNGRRCLSACLRPLAMGVLFICLAIYLGAINSRATVGYKIAALESDLGRLRESNEKLEIKTIELQQVSRIRMLAQGMKMVEALEVDYLLKNRDRLAVRAE